MGRTIDAAAAYVPRKRADGRRVAAADEDAFTLAATALERLPVGSASAPGPRRLLAVGDLPGSVEEDLPRFLGTPVSVHRVGTGAPALRRALASIDEAPDGDPPVLLVAVDLASRGSAGPDGAVALRSTPNGALPTERVLAAVPEAGELSAEPLLRFGAPLALADPARWVGDFTAATGDASGPPSPESPVPPDGPVSQGAYIPRPRYLESVAARWRLEGERCGACGTVGFPPRGRCRSCGAADGLAAWRLPRDGGVVVASTTIGPGGQPTEFDAQVAESGRYTVVLVDLAPGIRVTLQATDAASPPTVGARVGTRLRRLYPMEGAWRYGRKAVPLS